MNIFRLKKAILIVIIAVLFPAVGARAATSMTPKAIFARAGLNYDAVNDYIANAQITVESPQVHVPDMQVKIYFKRPDKIHLESKDGFAMLPRQGAVTGNPLKEITGATDLILIRSEKALGDDCYVVQGTIKKNDRSDEMTVWIDKTNFLVRQIAGNPEWGPSIFVKLWYMRVSNRYWMPKMTTAKISIPPMPSQRFEDKDKPGGPTIVALKFTGYRVNTGLSDKLFEKQKGSNKP